MSTHLSRTDIMEMLYELKFAYGHSIPSRLDAVAAAEAEDMFNLAHELEEMTDAEFDDLASRALSR